jgi:hypothetical protein
MSNIQDGRSGRPPSTPTLWSDSVGGRRTGTRREPTTTSGGNQQQAYSQPSPIRTRKTPSANVTHAIRGQRPVRHGTVREARLVPVPGQSSLVCLAMPMLGRQSSTARGLRRLLHSLLPVSHVPAQPAKMHSPPNGWSPIRSSTSTTPVAPPAHPRPQGLPPRPPGTLPLWRCPLASAPCKSRMKAKTDHPLSFVSSPVLAHRSPLPGGATPRCIVTPVLP